MEDVTATPADVIKGKTAYLQGQDDPLPGTLELTGNATDTYVYPGKTYYSTDPKAKRTGTMPTQAARTITPGASAQTVAAGRYLTGAITVPGFALPAANTIKKGTTINIYGRTVVGTFEGYVPGGADIYNRGAWGSGTNHVVDYGLEGTAALTAEWFSSTTGTRLRTKFTKNCIGYTKIVAEGTNFRTDTGNNSGSYFRGSDTTGDLTAYDPSSATTTRLEWILDTRVINAGAKQHCLDFFYECSVTRIYLS